MKGTSKNLNFFEFLEVPFTLLRSTGRASDKGPIMPTTLIIRLGILACIQLACMTGAGAAELSYALSSPLVGGNNSAPYQIELARDGQKKQIAAKAIADAKQLEFEAKAAINSLPTTRLVNALQSQLYTQIALKMSSGAISPTLGATSLDSADVLEVGTLLIKSWRVGDLTFVKIIDLVNTGNDLELSF